MYVKFYRKNIMISKRVVIIGAGPSGLSVAWGLAESKDIAVTILEAEDKVGGLSKTIEHKGLRFDIGPHRLSPQLPGIVDKIRGLLGADLLEKENLHGVFFNRKLYSYPPKAGDFVNLTSLSSSVIFGSSWIKARVRSVLRAPFRKTGHETFDGVLLDYFGKRFCEDVIFPMIFKVWGTRDLHSEFARIRFELPTFSKIAKKVFSRDYRVNDSVFYYPKNGFSQIWESLESHLKTQGQSIQTGIRLDSIEAETLNGPFRVSYTMAGRKMTETADVLVSTISNKTLLSKLSIKKPKPTMPVAPEDFPSRTLILGVLMIKDFSLPSRVIIFPEPKYVFNRISEMNQFSDLGYEGHSALMIDVICQAGTEYDLMDEASFNRMLVDSFLSLGWCKKENIKKVFSLKFPNSYPVLSRARYESQEALEDYLAGTGIVLCGREASSDYNNAHNAVGKGFLAAKYVRGKISFEDYRNSSRTIGRLPIQD